MQYSSFYRCRTHNNNNNNDNNHNHNDKSKGKKQIVKVLNKSYFYRFGNNNKRQRTVILNSLQNNMAILRTIEGKFNSILPIQGIYEDTHFLFAIVQECKGGNLMQHIQQRMKNKHGYSEFEVSTIMSKVTEALKVSMM